MDESVVFIPGRKGPFIFALIFITLTFFIVLFAVFTSPYDEFIIVGSILFFITLIRRGYVILNQLQRNKVGLFISETHLEDYSSISFYQKVKLSNIESTKIKSSWGSDLLTVHLKNKRDFIRTVPFFRKPTYWLNSIYYGAPVVIIEDNIQRTLEHVKILIDERIDNKE